MLVLVPTMELGVQEAMLIYKLFGGSVNPGIPGASANMFAYTGPRSLKVHFMLHCCMQVPLISFGDVLEQLQLIAARQCPAAI